MALSPSPVSPVRPALAMPRTAAAARAGDASSAASPCDAGCGAGDWRSLVALDASARARHDTAGSGASGTGAPDADGQPDALAPVVERVQSNLADAANDPEAFHALLEQSFGKSYDRAEAEAIRQQTLDGDFSWMPKIEVVGAATLQDTSGTQGAGQALGAYDASTDTVYISEELLTGDPDRAVAILTEEVGHALDARLNAVDSTGDEGEIFARLVGGETLSTEEINALRAENDAGTIVVNGREVEVEYGFFKSIGNAIGGAFKAVAGAVKSVVDGVVDAVKSVATVWVDAWKFVLESELVGKILMVAQFIPIPVVQVVARVANAARSAYAAVQGLKNGSISAFLGGVAGVAGGAANIGGALGASEGFVRGATNIARVADTASRAYGAVASGNWREAASLAANFFGGDVAPVLRQADRAIATGEALARGDLVGAAGAGTDLLGVLPDVRDDGNLVAAAGHANVLVEALDAVRDGRYGDAADAVLGGYADVLGIDAEGAAKVRTVVGAFETLSRAQSMFDRGDYAGGAASLFGAAATLGGDGAAKATLERAASTAAGIADVIDAFESGDLDGAANRALVLLREPLDASSRATLLDVLQRVEGAASAVRTPVPAAA